MKFCDFDLTGTEYNEIPTKILVNLEFFLYKGLDPGSFLTAVLDNDLHTAINRSDDESLKHLKTIVKFIRNYFPNLFLKTNSTENYYNSRFRYYLRSTGWAEKIDMYPSGVKIYNY